MFYILYALCVKLCCLDVYVIFLFIIKNKIKSKCLFKIDYEKNNS